jgi:hypothetical protein
MSILLALLACNPDPGHPEQGVDFRTPLAEGPQSGERGSVKISEVLWSGSVDDDGSWDPSDVFVEIRNEGSFQLDLSGWIIEESGALHRTFRIPSTDYRLDVGQHAFIAAKTTGCFPEPDWVIPELAFAKGGDPFELTLRDFDERLIEPIGSEELPAFAGGYDGVRSRSMERVELMFGGDGSSPHVWHFYTDAEVDVPNNDRISENCRRSTKASPGRPNSPDYSGAFAAGSLE